MTHPIVPQRLAPPIRFMAEVQDQQVVVEAHFVELAGGLLEVDSRPH